MIIHLAVCFQFHIADLIVNTKMYSAQFAILLHIMTAVMAITEISKYCNSTVHFHTARKY
jgi:hypothetical protein